jgi:hypothetical protein
MISFVQILGIIFGLIMLYNTFFHYKRKEFGKIQFILWGFIWTSFLFIVIFLRIASGIIQQFGFIRTLDFLVIVALVIITFLTFHNYTSLNALRKKLEKKTREDSLKDLR